MLKFNHKYISQKETSLYNNSIDFLYSINGTFKFDMYEIIFNGEILYNDKKDYIQVIKVSITTDLISYEDVEDLLTSNLEDDNDLLETIRNDTDERK